MKKLIVILIVLLTSCSTDNTSGVVSYKNKYKVKIYHYVNSVLIPVTNQKYAIYINDDIYTISKTDYELVNIGDSVKLNTISLFGFIKLESNLIK